MSISRYQLHPYHTQLQDIMMQECDFLPPQKTALPPCRNVHAQVCAHKFRIFVAKNKAKGHFMAKNNFFVVWEGKQPGIYHSWNECKKQVHGYGGAKYKGFATEAEAREAMASPCWDYIGKNAPKAKSATADWKLLPKNQQPIFPSMAVDAACSGNPGLLEYRGVDAANGQEVFHQGPFAEGTNNIGEFLALVHAMALLTPKNGTLPIYSDSITAQAWVRKKKAATKLEQTAANAPLFALVQRAEAWLHTHTCTNPILKWKTELWGEIPADFGRK